MLDFVDGHSASAVIDAIKNEGIKNYKVAVTQKFLSDQMSLDCFSKDLLHFCEHGIIS